MRRPTVIVTGFGRCGSSLTMRMLHAGGLPVVADDHESFEVTGAGLQSWQPEEVARVLAAPGHAVKVLDLHFFVDLFAGRGDFVVVLLERNHREQAASLAKLLNVFDPGLSGRPARRKFKRQIRNETPRLRAAAQLLSKGRVHASTFEALLADPRRESARLREFVNLHLGLRLWADRMPVQVRVRSPKCSPHVEPGFRRELEELRHV